MQKRFSYLFNRFAHKEATPSEQGEFFSMLNNKDYDDLLKTLMSDFYEYTDESNKIESIRFWYAQGAEQRMLNHIFKAGEVSANKSVMRLWPNVAKVAAIVITMFGAGLFYYELYNNKEKAIQTVYKDDVSPGRQGATLTLAGGQKIKLHDALNGKIAEEAGVTITKAGNGQLTYEVKGSKTDLNKINTLSTAKGETYSVRLPDGSVVYLNAVSSLTYSASLMEQGKRKVKLTGEGYFEIFKDKKHPFIVQTNKQEVEVLGTHFNISAYNDEPTIATTLLEGSVKITSANKQQLLKPGELAINDGSSINVRAVNTESITDWKEGDFYFDKVNFKTAMRKIARWYDVEIIYDPSLPDSIETGGWISRSKKLSAVLTLIESSGQVRFKIEGKRVYVSK